VALSFTLTLSKRERGQIVPPHGEEGQRPRVLEVGCGEGFVMRCLGQQLWGASFYAVDVDCRALRVAREQNKTGTFLCADATALPFAARAMDLVLCLEVLEHLRRPRQGLVELKRVARGPMIVSVPHQPYFSLANLARGKNLLQGGDDPEHVQRWRPKEFVALLAHEVQVSRVVYSFPWLVVLCQR